MDTRDSPLVRRTRPRTGVLNAHVWSIAQRHGAFVLDVWGMRSLHDWRMWAPDRIHLTTEGHRRVAQAALVALGLEPDDERWDDPLAPLPPLPRYARLRADATWLRDHAYPWATRRLRGRLVRCGPAPQAARAGTGQAGLTGLASARHLRGPASRTPGRGTAHAGTPTGAPGQQPGEYTS